MDVLALLGRRISEAYRWSSRQAPGRDRCRIMSEGRVAYGLWNEDGSLAHAGRGVFVPPRPVCGRTHNLVVTSGLNWLREYGWDSATVMTQMGWIAIGSDGTAPGAGNTTLLVETARVAYTPDISGGDGVVSVAADFGPGVGTGTVAEGGVFSDVAAGDMFDRFLIGPMTKGAGQTLTVQVTITFTAL